MDDKIKEELQKQFPQINLNAPPPKQEVQARNHTIPLVKDLTREDAIKRVDNPKPGQYKAGAVNEKEIAEMGNASPTNAQQPQIITQPQQEKPNVAAVTDGLARTEGPNPNVGNPKPLNLKKINPILAKLREDLGLDKIKTFTADIGGHKWTMRIMNQDMLGYAQALADARSHSPSERNYRETIANAACCIVAIDDAPVYSLFEIDITGISMNDPFNPPPAIGKSSALFLYDYFLHEIKSQVPIKVYYSYVKELDPLSDIPSYMDGDNSIEFTCNAPEGCDYTFRDRLMRDANNEIKPYFCKFHGIVMVPKAEVEKVGEDSLPLQ